MQPLDDIDRNDSPINAEPEELTMLRFELAEVESLISRLNPVKHTRIAKRALFKLHVKRDALRAQIKVWNESELDLPW